MAEEEKEIQVVSQLPVDPIREWEGKKLMTIEEALSFLVNKVAKIEKSIT